MDTNDISISPGDVASESTFESEIDALAKIITDTKDDIHKLDDNDEVFKLDSDISFTDSLQGHCAKNNKSELTQDDNLILSDILDGTRELENFIPTSNADNDLQEVLGETFENIEDSNSKINQLHDQIIDQKNDGTILSEQSSVNNVTLLNASDNVQGFCSDIESPAASASGNATNQSLTAAGIEIHQQSMEKIESNAVDTGVDPILTDCLSEITEKDDSQKVFDRKLGVTKESNLDSTATERSENKSIDQTDFTQKPDLSCEFSSEPIISIKDRLQDEPSIDTEKQQKEFKLEDLNIPGSEVMDYAKETDVHKISIDTTVVQQATDTENNDKETDGTEASESCLTEDIVKNTSITSKNIDNTVMNANCQLIGEPKVIEEIPAVTAESKIVDELPAIIDEPKDFEGIPAITAESKIVDELPTIMNEPKDVEEIPVVIAEPKVIEKIPVIIDEPTVVEDIPSADQLQKQENIENNELEHCESTNNLTETLDLENFNEEENKNNVKSECSTSIIGTEISKNLESTSTDIKRSSLEGIDSIVEVNRNLEDKNENTEDSKNIDMFESANEIVHGQDTTEDPLNSNVEKQISSNAKIEESISSENINNTVSQSNIVEKDEQLTESENPDVKLSLEQEGESSMKVQDLSKDILNPLSTESKEMSDESKISIATENTVGTSNDQQEPGSRELASNESLNEVPGDISNFDDSEVLHPNLQSPEEKSQDTLLILNAIRSQIENEKLTASAKEEDITFEESSQSPTPMQSDKFINDLFNSCMPDDTTQFSNTEMESIKESGDCENLKSELEMETNEGSTNVENLKSTPEISKPASPTEIGDLLETEALKMESARECTDIENSKPILKIEDEQLAADSLDTEIGEKSVVPENSKPSLEIEDQRLDTGAPEMENIEGLVDPENTNSALELEDQQTIRTVALEVESSKESSDLPALENENEFMETGALENASEFPSDETQAEKVVDEPSDEISELESAVKFLQESEQSTDNAPAVPVSEENPGIFVSVEETECDNVSEAISDLPETTLDPIAISEAEIISEAAKLENERKEKLELEKLKSASPETSNTQDVDEAEFGISSTARNLSSDARPIGIPSQASVTSAEDILKIPLSIDTRLTPETAGIVDNRYKEPPKIEIPETSKLVELPKSALLIQKQRLDSPDRQTTSSCEPKISETPTKKDSSDKQQQQQQQPECENVGSPRIILKIAKSAIAECSEPRSPKSPKVRSSDSPNPEDSPSSQKLGKIKLKLSKGGHPSIIPSGDSHQEETWHTDCTTSSLSPMAMKIKITKSSETSEDPQKLEEPKEKMETTLGMKIKLSKSGDASIVQQDNKETAQETIIGKKQDSPSLGMKIKLSKTGDASIIQQDKLEHIEDDGPRRTESPIGMKIKLSKSGDASVISNEPVESAKECIDEPIKRTDSPIGVKIKLAKNKGGSASIISTDSVEEVAESSTAKSGIGMKIKLSKSGDASVIHTTKDDAHEAMEQPIGMKIKLSKTGDPSIIPSGFSREYEDIAHKSKHSRHREHGTAGQRSKDDSHLEMKIKLSKTGHPTIITHRETTLSPLKTTSMPTLKAQGDHADIISFKKSHSDVTIEPIKTQLIDPAMVDLHAKRKEITIAPIESKKPKIDAMLPDITIQPISAKKEQSQKLVLESNTGSISRQQMTVINQEISITQVRSLAPGDSLMGEHLKSALNAPTEGSTPSSSDCEIIEAQPELIIVNENSNSSQDVMIIDEVPPQVKTPKKRGRPRRNALPAAQATTFQGLDQSRDPLSLEQPAMRTQIPPQMQLQMPAATMLQQVPPQHIVPPASDGSERPRRTCRNQKSYAPPKRGRRRGRGKRKNEAVDIPMKKPRVEQEFVGMEDVAKPMISLEKLPLEASSSVKNSPELFKALNQPSLNQSRDVEIFKMTEPAKALDECEVVEIANQSTTMNAVQQGGMEVIKMPSHGQVPSMHLSSDVQAQLLHQQEDQSGVVIKVTGEDDGKQAELVADNGKEPDQNWVAPSIKKVSGDVPSRNETISSLTVMDEETRMSAESSSRSQTPARNMSAPGAVDTLVNEESQNSVLSTATTESEKVKQPKNRRMEISFDPDEGPFTVDKIAEYEWPTSDKINEPKSAGSRGDTYMIQEQISQYLGVKSFKRKYPDLKRRMVEMEERNFLRENALVSESMCDLGLTAVSSSEVLDVMCSDFPEQYEEYRKHMREKAAREHSKKQKELSAAANAERNRIDLAEMAMQSAISWNSGFNKARQESRRCSLDLQTFTVHMPRRPPKYDPARRGCNYPCALITGQYTDYYREYKPAELRYYPLNTVVYGPTKPNERKFDSQSEGSQSDSDSDSSSDDSSSTSSEGTQDTEGSQSTMDEVDMELALDPSIKCKMCSNHLNKNNRPETLIVCGTCNGNVHPSCIDLTLDMVPHIRAYAWQCTDCKTCAQCHDPADEDKMLFCDMCDRGYHIYCVGLRRVPQGRWHCQECAVCANCGSKEPGGANSDRNSVAQWQHEFKKGDKNTRVYVSTFCVPCSKLWRKGRYCPHCSRCHNATRLDQEPNLVHCGACDKYLHLECVETKGMTIDRRNYLCEFCSPNRQQLVKPLTSKTFKT